VPASGNQKWGVNVQDILKRSNQNFNQELRHKSDTKAHGKKEVTRIN